MKKRAVVWILAAVLAVQMPVSLSAGQSVSENSIEGTKQQKENKDTSKKEEAVFSYGELAETEQETLSENDADIHILSYRDIDKGEPESAERIKAVDEFPNEMIFNIPKAYRSDQVDTNGDGEPDKNYLPAFRRQGPYGTCWAFSALGACEASLLRKNLIDSDVDFSESHLAYFFYQKGEKVGDFLGNTEGDYNRNLQSNFLQLGGNGYFTMWHLASWAGPVSEYAAKDFAYQNVSASLKLPNNTATVYGMDAAHVQNVYIIGRKDTKSVKQMIMQYGAVATSYYAAESKKDEQLYDSFAAGKVTDDEGGYYCYQKKNTNHAIQIVGWDDHYSRENFVTKPDMDGAWLVKNSWGEENKELAQNGYFWMSYKDQSLSSVVFVYDCELADNYDNIYQYDGASGYSTCLMYQAANVFTVPSGAQAKGEKLEAVSVGIENTNVNYQLDIYTFPMGTKVNVSNLTNGTRAYTKKGKFAYAGYHTVVLDHSVNLAAGQTYAVVFTFPDGTVYVNYDETYNNGDWLRFVTNQKSGQSFYKASVTGSFRDCANTSRVGGNIRIKAFTNDAASVTASALSLNKAELTLEKEEGIKLEAIVAGASSPKVTWMSSNEEIATVTNGYVLGVGGGEAVITARCGDKTAQCKVLVLSPLIDISMANASMTIIEGQRVSVPVLFNPADTTDSKELSFTSSNPETAVVENGILCGIKKGTAVITATASNGTTAQMTVVVRRPIKGISLNRTLLTMDCRDSLQLTAAITPEDTTDSKVITWQTSNSRVATVVNGLVTATGYGTAMITARTSNGITASCKVNVKTTDAATPVVLSTCSKSSSQIQLDWVKASNGAGYEIYRSTKKSGTYRLIKDIKDVTKTSFIDKKVSCGQTYYYKIKYYARPNGIKVSSEFSKVYQVKAVPAAVTISKITRTAKSAKITWKKVAKAAGYEIYRSTSASAKGKKVAAVDRKNSYTDKGIKKNTTYYYRVRAYQMVGSKKIYGIFSEVEVTNGK